RVRDGGWPGARLIPAGRARAVPYGCRAARRLGSGARRLCDQRCVQPDDQAVSVVARRSKMSLSQAAINNQAVLAIRTVSKSYRVDGRTLQVLSRIALDIAPGEFVSVVGASGCGKSTL